MHVVAAQNGGSRSIDCLTDVLQGQDVPTRKRSHDQGDDDTGEFDHQHCMVHLRTTLWAKDT
jgi:hypothetical protein